ncbi:hypothetical protein PINS_up019384 [Pythium insidiosum]|nr:hypothetical protein PINS_up019384 [Pythium insidiosum]
MPNVREETPFDVANRSGSRTSRICSRRTAWAPPTRVVQQVDHAFANDPQLAASLARNRPEIAEIIVKNRVKYAQYFSLGCLYEENPASDDGGR